ncbi:MAG: hypothetical protein J1G38_04910 [Clostridiales bacterium]|nr:hypothetical protein [Clostridiales bacterium]
MENKKEFSLKYFIYAMIVLVSVILISFFITWASIDEGEQKLNRTECEVIASEGARREYLVGEEFSLDGLALKIGSKNYSDCDVTVDMSSAGVKRATVSRTNGSQYYYGYFDVTVYAIRHFEIVGLDNPDNLYLGAAGELVCQNEVIKLDLNAHPQEFNVENPDMPNVITLSQGMYTKTTAQDENYPERYTLSFSVGTLNVSYTCVNIGSRVLMLNSERRILEFANRADGDEKLTLYVTKTTGLGGDGSDLAEGVYVFTDASGMTYYFNFKYYAIGWDSYFDSASLNAGKNFSDRYIGWDDAYREGIEVSCNGCTFAVGPDPWHVAVLNM